MGDCVETGFHVVQFTSIDDTTVGLAPCVWITGTGVAELGVTAVAMALVLVLAFAGPLSLSEELAAKDMACGALVVTAGVCGFSRGAKMTLTLWVDPSGIGIINIWCEPGLSCTWRKCVAICSLSCWLLEVTVVADPFPAFATCEIGQFFSVPLGPEVVS